MIKIRATEIQGMVWFDGLDIEIAGVREFSFLKVMRLINEARKIDEKVVYTIEALEKYLHLKPSDIKDLTELEINETSIFDDNYAIIRVSKNLYIVMLIQVQDKFNGSKGSKEDEEYIEDDLEEQDAESDDGDDANKKKKVAPNYGKIAKAIGDIISSGIKVSLANINKSGFGFAPDVENNQILFGMKGMLNVGDDIIASIIENRPYSSIKDFYYKVKPTKQTMISLIKGGAFDEMEDRKFAMAWYLWETCDKKTRITLQNMPSLIKYNMLPEDTEERIMARRVYEFNRYLKAITKADPYAYKDMYSLDTRAISFLYEIDCEELTITDNISHFLRIKDWDKVYQKYMDVFRDWIAKDKNEILTKLNTIIFKEDWDKYAQGNISAWEMEALCFYYHEHELAHLNQYRYGFADFNKLPEDPVIDRTFTKGGKEIKIFKLDKICGTCIAKNKVKSTVTLLTTTGVVNVKFRKEYFSLFDKQISVRGEDGVKHVVEKSWFNRGNMIVVNGMRSGDDFISKKYASTSGHQLYRIEKINEDGTLELKDHRFQGGIEEDD